MPTGICTKLCSLSRRGSGVSRWHSTRKILSSFQHGILHPLCKDPESAALEVQKSLLFQICGNTQQVLSKDLFTECWPKWFNYRGKSQSKMQRVPYCVKLIRLKKGKLLPNWGELQEAENRKIETSRVYLHSQGKENQVGTDQVFTVQPAKLAHLQNQNPILIFFI